MLTIGLCLSGYSLNKYTTSDIVLINSQVNEQANAGLQRIKMYVRPTVDNISAATLSPSHDNSWLTLDQDLWASSNFASVI